MVNVGEKSIAAKSSNQNFHLLNIFPRIARITKKVSRPIRQYLNSSAKYRLPRAINLPARLLVKNGSCMKTGVVSALSINLYKTLFFPLRRVCQCHSTIINRSENNRSRYNNSQYYRLSNRKSHLSN